MNYDMKEEFNPEDFFYDEEYQGYEVYIDESLKKQKNKLDKAGYGIHFMRKHKYNFYESSLGNPLQNDFFLLKQTLFFQVQIFMI